MIDFNTKLLVIDPEGKTHTVCEFSRVSNDHRSFSKEYVELCTKPGNAKAKAEGFCKQNDLTYVNHWFDHD